MRIGILWNAPQPLKSISVRHELYVQGLTALGHNVTLYASEDAARDFPHSCTGVDDKGKFLSPAWWRKQNLDLVLTITWHRCNATLAALRAAKITVIGIADSDGNISFRTHARAAFERMWQGRAGRLSGLQTLRVFFHIWRRAPLHADKEVMDSLALCDRFLMSWPLFKERFAAMLKQYGREDLVSRVDLAPYPVQEPFLKMTVGTKKPRIVAIGRWDDGQKNTPLLLNSLRLFCSKFPEAEVVILGSDTAKNEVAAFAESLPTVEYKGVCDVQVTAEVCSKARIFLSTSRWESGPLAANETLCLGATVVGSDNTSFRDITDGGNYGETFKKPTPKAVAEALETEWLRWEGGKRSPKEIAKHWRSLLSPKAVAEKVLGDFHAAVERQQDKRKSA